MEDRIGPPMDGERWKYEMATHELWFVRVRSPDWRLKWETGMGSARLNHLSSSGRGFLGLVIRGNHSRVQ